MAPRQESRTPGRSGDVPGVPARQNPPGGEFAVDLSVDDPAVARAVVTGFPDGVTGEVTYPTSPEGADTAITGTVDGTPRRNERGHVVLANVVIEAVAHGHAAIDVDSATASTTDGTTLALGAVGDDVFVDASHQVGGEQPHDLDGDGLFEDLNGNGRLDSDDLVTFFEEMDASGIQEHYRFYDYNGNSRIDFDDLVTLFEEL